MLMFALSIFAFIGNHLSVLYLLKATSAPQDAYGNFGCLFAETGLRGPNNSLVENDKQIFGQTTPRFVF